MPPLTASRATAKLSLPLSHLRLYLLPQQPLHLPALNKGNSLRGGFGNAFRKLVCVDLRWECADCALRSQCPYTRVFNPFIPPDAPQFSGNRNIPRPFVVKPPRSEQTRYAIGDALVFDLVLIGAAIDYLPYFIVAFRELGTMGFGLNRARVQLTRVEAIGANGVATPVYDASTNVVRPVAAMELPVVGSRYSAGSGVAAGEDSASPHPDPLLRGEGENRELTLEFLTPTTLKSGSTAAHPGAIVRRPAFHHVAKRLRDRINALATFYGSGPLDIDFKGLGAAAEAIETIRDETRWVERTRYSHRREMPHDLSGFVGALTVRGPLAAFVPLLRRPRVSCASTTASRWSRATTTRSSSSRATGCTSARRASG
jgi:hypothetical protein